MKNIENTSMNQPQYYDIAWSELNQQLQVIEMQHGLGAALLGLERHQQQTGFIKDLLQGIRWYTYFHPDDPSHYFRIQYNPMRALRFAGSGIKTPPHGIDSINNGCFLCRNNIVWQQEGIELGYDISINNRDYYAWMNPFPLMPTHTVISTQDHTSQEWALSTNGTLGIERLVHDLVGLAERLPGFIGFYNGINAGASIPGHMHYQFFHRLSDEPLLPLERTARNFSPQHGDESIVEQYPVHVVMWKGDMHTVQASALPWIEAWAERNHEQINQLSANIIATRDPYSHETSLYFVPRHQERSRANGMSGLVGGLEIMGELVFSTEEELALLEQNTINYFTIETILSQVFVDAK